VLSAELKNCRYLWSSVCQFVATAPAGPGASRGATLEMPIASFHLVFAFGGDAFLHTEWASAAK
jgi:hypothetical protein